MFADRLVNDEDRGWFSHLLSERMSTDFKVKFEDVITSDPLLYADFMALTYDQRAYVEITDHVKVLIIVSFNHRTANKNGNKHNKLQETHQEMRIPERDVSHIVLSVYLL